MRIYSWNVNGLRAAHGKGFLPWLAQSGADVVGVQEVRARTEQLPEPVHSPEGWHTHFVAAERPGYSGVGLFARRQPDELHEGLGQPELDCEGRLQLARFGRLWVVNGYFPNGNGKDRDNSRVPYKLEFYRALFAHLEPLRRAGEPVLVMGDLNTAHTELDLARPKDNRETSGFLPEECEELDRWIRSGWTDTFRRFERGAGHYSWWSQRFGVRARNIGWRIDYILASEAAVPFLQGARIHPEIMGSDHCPISVELDAAVVGAAGAARATVGVQGKRASVPAAAVALAAAARASGEAAEAAGGVKGKRASGSAAGTALAAAARASGEAAKAAKVVGGVKGKRASGSATGTALATAAGGSGEAAKVVGGVKVRRAPASAAAALASAASGEAAGGAKGKRASSTAAGEALAAAARAIGDAGGKARAAGRAPRKGGAGR